MAALTLPIGVAIMGHAATREGFSRKASIHASMAAWLLMTLGMMGWASPKSLPIPVIVLDSTVNIIGMVAATFA